MPRVIYGIYFAVQGLLVILWWALLLTRPELARLFSPPSWPSAALFAFIVPDLAIVAGGSVAAGVLVFRRSPRAPYAMWVVAGSIWYASLYCLDVWLATGAAVSSVALMAPAAIVSVSIAVAASRS